MLVHELEHVVLLLLVNLLREYHLLVVINRVINALCRILGFFYLSEDFLDFLLYLLYVDITYDNDTLKVGTVPLLVIVAQCLIREIVNNLHYTYRKTFAVSAVGEDVGKHTLLHTHHRSVASSPLFVYHTALLVNLFSCKSKSVGPVAENPET